jgi:hypothetical protein
VNRSVSKGSGERPASWERCYWHAPCTATQPWSTFRSTSQAMCSHRTGLSQETPSWDSAEPQHNGLVATLSRIQTGTFALPDG